MSKVLSAFLDWPLFQWFYFWPLIPLTSVWCYWKCFVYLCLFVHRCFYIVMYAHILWRSLKLTSVHENVYLKCVILTIWTKLCIFLSNRFIQINVVFITVTNSIQYHSKFLKLCMYVSIWNKLIFFSFNSFSRVVCQVPYNC